MTRIEIRRFLARISASSATGIAFSASEPASGSAISGWVPPTPWTCEILAGST
jgi:hypothetical protein